LNIKCHENPSSGSRVDGEETDMTKFFRNFSKRDWKKKIFITSDPFWGSTNSHKQWAGLNLALIL